MPSLTLHFAHRRVEGWPLGLIWLAMIAGGWTGAYLFARLVIAVAHGLGTLLP